mmetsp:Transcript_27483/g.57875  ORF Transcript_27483/g.57875 Transcript_27483/m.57875 type:complete len:214 (+) Transcript_27483:758-1399(+)
MGRSRRYPKRAGSSCTSASRSTLMSRTKSSQRLATWLCSDCNLDALSHVSRMRSSLPTMRVLCSKFCCCSCFSCSTVATSCACTISICRLFWICWHSCISKRRACCANRSPSRLALPPSAGSEVDGKLARESLRASRRESESKVDASDGGKLGAKLGGKLGGGFGAKLEPELGEEEERAAVRVGECARGGSCACEDCGPVEREWWVHGCCCCC